MFFKYFDSLFKKLKKGETPFWFRMKKIVKKIMVLSVPSNFIHNFFYRERCSRIFFLSEIFSKIYYEPMFKTRCDTCGKYLKLIGGIPLVFSGLKLYIGDNVIMHGATTLSGSKLFEDTRVVIGNNSYLGYGVTIAAGKEVIIGNHVLIANYVSIFADDLHPIDPVLRSQGLPSEFDQIQPVYIQDHVWIGESAKILKGVTIGEASIVGVGSVVTHDVPPYTIVAGNPARKIREIPRG